MHMYRFSTDILNSADYYIWFRSYPVIERGQQKVTYTEVPGRAGTLTTKDGSWTDTVVTMELDITVPVFESCSVDQIYSQFREKVLDSRLLYLEEISGKFFQIKNTETTGYSRESDITISVDLTITCDPGEYLISGTREYSPDKVLKNRYSVCCPTYLITGNGGCTLTVNGKKMTATVGQNLTIHTERMLACRTDGTLQNTAVKGAYKDLYLQPGENTIAITKGFDLKVIPNWRCL
ncbi:Uncharacterised protein [uncultured Roseburia sp.]|uniref:Phage tail protein n=1 Tax=Brotonthovivens ammoniilytica TaxID=2981725 RepID=A0ABT2TP91_9FIRM|nr:hypothetical protein [Brotonthovivens ammoniilytica]MCU6763516.1 hypothetical protein [Brotonthovivens ammoniilytica]SCJ23656.1 Uncharacterised protein [uncultured Roseburia sp.]